MISSRSCKDSFVLVERIDVGGGFDPLVEIAIVPGKTLVLALLETEHDLEIVITMPDIALQDRAHVRHHHLGALLPFVGPKTFRPTAVAEVDAAEFDVRTLRMIDDGAGMSVGRGHRMKGEKLQKRRRGRDRAADGEQFMTSVRARSGSAR